MPLSWTTLVNSETFTISLAARNSMRSSRAIGFFAAGWDITVQTKKKKVNWKAHNFITSPLHLSFVTYTVRVSSLSHRHGPFSPCVLPPWDRQVASQLAAEVVH